MKMIVDEISVKYDENIQTVSRGGLMSSSSPLRDCVFQSFGIIEIHRK